MSRKWTWALLALLARPGAGEFKVEDSWHAAYIGDQKVGYLRTLADRVEANGQTVVHYRIESVLSVKRFNDTMKLVSVADSFELTDGRLYAVEAVMKMANQVRKTKGLLNADGKFLVTIEQGAKTDSQSLAWDGDVLGPYAVESLFRKTVPKPGDTKTVRTFLPEMNEVRATTVNVVGKRNVTLRDGKQVELTLVEQTTDGLPIKISNWLDDKGEIVTTAMPIGDQIIRTYKVSQAEAIDQPKGKGLDLGVRTLITSDQPIPNAHQTKRVAYKLTIKDTTNVKDIFPEASYQKILDRSLRGNDGVIRMECRKVVAGVPTAAAEKPGDEFLAPNGFIRSDHGKIVATAEAQTKGITDPWAKALKLEDWVHRNMVNRDFSIGFADAAEVIETRQGDCTEHAVLLAALCRAAQIPARVAMGLVYVEGRQQFGYHMWTEVWVNGQWLGLDGTLGQGFIAGGHIKIGDGSLKGVNALATFLPVFQVIGKLSIAVEAVD